MSREIFPNANNRPVPHIYEGAGGEQGVIFAPKGTIIPWEDISALGLSNPVKQLNNLTSNNPRNLELSPEEAEDDQSDRN